MKKNVGDLKMSLKQARKLYVLERLCEGGFRTEETSTRRRRPPERQAASESGQKPHQVWDL